MDRSFSSSSLARRGEAEPKALLVCFAILDACRVGLVLELAVSKDRQPLRL